MRTIVEIEADITAARAQQSAVLLGQAVVEVWRDGRRMKLQVTTPEQLAAHIADLERELAAAQIEAGITPTRTRRRSALRLGWA